jgi:HK97 family phage prohead protease
MKPEPIVVPYLNHYSRRADIAAKMAVRGDARGASGHMWANHEASTFKRPAIRGAAVVYGEMFEHEGELCAFVPGCFSAGLRSGKPVEFRADHAEPLTFAGALRFDDNVEGLMFEFEPEQDERGAIVLSLCASGGRTDVSVGARHLEVTTRNIRGHDVRLITKADIAEISLCATGRVPNSHARVVDLANAMTLEAEASTGVLRMAGLINETVTRSKALAAHFHEPEPVRRSYGVDHIWE